MLKETVLPPQPAAALHMAATPSLTGICTTCWPLLDAGEQSWCVSHFCVQNGALFMDSGVSAFCIHTYD
jgi:hypothetical protein